MALGAGLLRAHVSRRADQPGPLAKVFFAEREPKVRDDGLTVAVQQNIGGFDVPVHQSALVGVMKRFSDPHHDFDRGDERGPALFHPLRQIVRLDERTYEVTEPFFRPTDVVHRQQARMLEAREDASFAEVGFDLLGGSDAVRHFHGDFSAQVVVVSLIDCPEPAFADLG